MFDSNNSNCWYVNSKRSRYGIHFYCYQALSLPTDTTGHHKKSLVFVTVALITSSATYYQQSKPFSSTKKKTQIYLWSWTMMWPYRIETKLSTKLTHWIESKWSKKALESIQHENIAVQFIFFKHSINSEQIKNSFEHTQKKVKIE